MSQHKEKSSKSSSSLIKIVTKSHSTHSSSSRPNTSHPTTTATAAAAPSFLSSVLNAPSTLFHTNNNASSFPPQFSLHPPEGLDESSRLSTASAGEGQGPTPTSSRPNNPSRPKAAWGQGLRRQVNSITTLSPPRSRHLLTPPYHHH